MAMYLYRLNDREDVGDALTSFIRARKQPIFSA
jgi:hypothetical protein